MALTRAQKEAIAWCDLVAGLASAELGPVSFVIAGAASMAYYKDKVAQWATIAPTPGGTPSDSNNQGELHNLLCNNYLAAGYDSIDYDSVIATATEVRPDLSAQVQGIDAGYFNEKVASTVNLVLDSTDQKVAAVTTFFPLNDADTATLFSCVQNITDGSDDAWEGNVEFLIAKVSYFKMPDEEKDSLKRLLEILKRGPIVWGQ